ncbi:LOB domain-containing protein 40 [Impatiens glandulifera]|uniref:LOB domain-containing protein 40 n=1 Tax=Impatiens glandulifera TaxID=253017 RepID=UPI001FB09120|nr:LOB domain-containing protein 40 [Impatiens glandulifera]
MRMSCNGCRVLRKGCNENCSIRPCLHWIKSPESQANATVFLAKFYGRAGLMNLINAGPDHLRPAVFRSLLYEACGRIVNPIYGSVGLLWSGNWALCQTAVEAVLEGVPITQFASESDEANNGPPLKAYDIRHVSKDENLGNDHLHRVRDRCQFKKSGGSRVNELGKKKRSTSHESSLSHQSEVEIQEDFLLEESLVFHPPPAVNQSAIKAVGTPHVEEGLKEDFVELGLTLGFNFQSAHDVSPKKDLPPRGVWNSISDVGGESCRTKLGL